jgi:phosphatidylinositol alpha-1,6-mannosyltransferase
VRLRAVAGAFSEAIYRWHVASTWMRKWRPDALIASGERSVWLAAGLARQFQFPWVAVGHGTEFSDVAAWERRLTRWSFQQATAVVSVSQYTQQRMLAIGICPRMMRVIPNGADPARFQVLPSAEVPAFRESLGLNGCRLLLTVGSVTERKGQSVVIRALPHILAKAPNTHYLMAGMPSKEHEFTLLARKLGVADHVHFLGRVDARDVVRYLNCCDLFVMTSRHTKDGDFEGYGIAVVEAALCGLPAVVSANSGLMEAIADGETGLLVPEDDEIGTAEAVLLLLRDDAARCRMGEAARRRALREQTWEHRVTEYDRLLRGLSYDGFDGAGRVEAIVESSRDRR